MNDVRMRIAKPPIHQFLLRLQRQPLFRNPALLATAASLLIVSLLAIISLLQLPVNDEFGLESPAVPARFIRGVQEPDRQVATIAGTISTTFSGEMSRMNRASLAEKAKELLASRIDLDGAAAKGASYRILYEEKLAGGKPAGIGSILAVEVSTAKQRVNAYRFTDARGGVGYYDERGAAIMDRPLFRQPCDYERVSSEFGYRRHPISRLIRFHGGIDLAAQTGTPVRAAADGIVAFSGRNGGAGNMVTISHDGGMATQYLHLSRFTAAGTSGNRVRQGDVIGYVGSTGSSTGPHLDFRVIVDGMLRDPLAMLMRPAPKRSLTPAELSGLLARIDLYKAEADKSMFRVAGISGRPSVLL